MNLLECLTIATTSDLDSSGEVLGVYRGARRRVGGLWWLPLVRRERMRHVLARIPRRLETDAELRARIIDTLRPPRLSKEDVLAEAVRLTRERLVQKIGLGPRVTALACGTKAFEQLRSLPVQHAVGATVMHLEIRHVPELEGTAIIPLDSDGDPVGRWPRWPWTIEIPTEKESNT